MSINIGKNIPERYEKIMSISANEFARSIVLLPGGADAKIAEDKYLFPLESGEVLITTTKMDDHVIKGSLLVLPRHRVRFDFREADQAARNAFVIRFDSSFQRGGG